MQTKIEFSFKPYPETSAESQIHNLGNIADNVWKEKVYLERGRIEGARFIAAMILTPDRRLRKKEKDILLQKLEKLDPALDARIQTGN